MSDQPPPASAQSRAGTPEPAALTPATMFGLALGVGLLAGLGSIAFRAAIALFQHLFFFGELGLALAPGLHLPPSTWGWGVILVPVAGAVVVTAFNNTLAPETRGHGVPEVMDAIYYHGGRIRPLPALARAVAAAVSIGSGGSVGREGPIMHIGAAFGSVLGRVRAMPARQRVVLVGAGAGAAIAATFNAPLGGIAFAMELLLVSVSARNIALVASATVTATWVGRLYGGMGPTFAVPALDLFADRLAGSYQLLLCIPFGLLAGVAAAGFVRALYAFEDRFESAFDNTYLRHMSGMLVVGLMLWAFLQYTGAYYVDGVGYATIADILRGVLTDPLFLLLLFAAKLLATCLTLGSGASGGVFSPTLFLGATLGAAYADALDGLLPQLGIDPVVFAVAGMAGMVGATTSAVITAIVLVFEQARDFSVILPIVTTVALAYVVRVRLTPESIYTLKLARRGHAVPQGLQVAMSVTFDARKVMNRDFRVIELDRLRAWAKRRRPGERARYTVVVHNGEIHGLARDDLADRLDEPDVEALVDRDFRLVAPRTRWPALMRTIKASGTDRLLVASRRSVDDLRGVITPLEIAHAARDHAELID